MIFPSFSLIACKGNSKRELFIYKRNFINICICVTCNNSAFIKCNLKFIIFSFRVKRERVRWIYIKLFILPPLDYTHRKVEKDASEEIYTISFSLFAHRYASCYLYQINGIRVYLTLCYLCTFKNNFE